jgi:hypothetical protein
MTEKYKISLTFSPKAAELWDECCEEFEGFDEEVDEEFEIIEGSARACEVFQALESFKTGTFFWDGSQYMIFPLSERDLLTLIRKTRSDCRAYDLAMGETA